MGVSTSKVIAVMFVAAGGVVAQSTAPPPAFETFDAATIKPTAADNQGGRFMTM
jgi:hypothetical protein